ncbi:hypothetical protein KMT30_47450, partial [Streptomyces sp. IBSBF 2953]|nr:hypothetical protein [Streptomyces hayashii]
IMGGCEEDFLSLARKSALSGSRFPFPAAHGYSQELFNGNCMSRMGIPDLEAWSITARKQMVFGWAQSAHRICASQ